MFNFSRLFSGLLLVILIFFSFFFKLDLVLYVFIFLFVIYDLIYSKIIQSYNILILVVFILFLIILNLTIKIPVYLVIGIYFSLFFLSFLKSIKIINLAFSLNIIIFIYIFFTIGYLDRNGFYILILLSFINDTSAYIFGKLIGGPKIIKKISPNKTWSGTISSFLISVIFLFLNNFSVFISIIIAISLFFGDIYFSYIKRCNKLSDFSNSIKGHGGILDRLDSIFISSFIIFLFA